MAKRFKIRLSLLNFQLCRPNPKSSDISFPTGPPTSPDNASKKGESTNIKTLKIFSMSGTNEIGTLVLDEGVAMEMRSEDPYKDFRQSMIEMILEKQMCEVDALERLLQCFLLLNLPEYHATILEAFTDVWEGLFSD